MLESSASAALARRFAGCSSSQSMNAPAIAPRIAAMISVIQASIGYTDNFLNH
jgi:hypothetical protein